MPQGTHSPPGGRFYLFNDKIQLWFIIAPRPGFRQSPGTQNSAGKRPANRPLPRAVCIFIVKYRLPGRDLAKSVFRAAGRSALQAEITLIAHRVFHAAGVLPGLFRRNAGLLQHLLKEQLLFVVRHGGSLAFFS